VADPDIQQGGHIIWWIKTFSHRGLNLTCFPVSHVYFFVGGCQSLQLNWMGVMAGFSPLPTPGSATGHNFFKYSLKRKMIHRNETCCEVEFIIFRRVLILSELYHVHIRGGHRMHDAIRSRHVATLQPTQEPHNERSDDIIT